MREPLSDLAELLRFQSVSAHPARTDEVRACAGWLARRLRAAGLLAGLVETGGHPCVLGEWRQTPDRPTVLVYGHYDVQPAEPLGEWRTPPFEATVRGDDLYGRGASDDKGQLLAHVWAIERLLSRDGSLPVNVVCLFEGEEEIGSPNLRSFLLRHGRRLGADVAVISDTRMLGPRQPVITDALRGSVRAEVVVDGPPRDLHSGTFGGAVRNPAQALCEMLARLLDGQGCVTIPGFYRDVRELSASERARLRRAGPIPAKLLADAGVSSGWGEPGYEPYERTVIRPSLTVTSLQAGTGGPGSKSVVPARATASLNVRLVPEQDPAEIADGLRRHLGSVAPPSVRVQVRARPVARAVVVDRHHPGIRAAVAACRTAFGADPVFLRSGGTIPVVSHLEDLLGLTTVLMGFGLPDDRIHGPNEKVHLPTLRRGVVACERFLVEMGRRSQHARQPADRARL